MFETQQTICIGMVGQSGIGKTHLINRYLKNSLPKKTTPTIAVEFDTGLYKVQDGSNLKIKIWDSSGQQKYNSIVCYHLKEVKAIVLVYDITNFQTFQKIDKWITRIQSEHIDYDLLVLMGNKKDLEKKHRKVKKSQGRAKAKQIEAYFYEVSSFDHQKVKQIFDEIAQAILEKKANRQIAILHTQREQLKQIKDKQTKPPVQGAYCNINDAVCSNCQIY